MNTSKIADIDKKKVLEVVLHEKGGVAKSLVMATRADYLNSKGFTVLCINTDTGHNTLAQYEGLSVVHIDLFEVDDNGVPHLDISKLDDLANIVLESNADYVLVDNGGSSFQPMMTWWLSVAAGEFFRDSAGVTDIVIHTVLADAGHLKSNTARVAEVIKHLGEKTVIWENRHLGPCDLNGTPFMETAVAREHEDRIRVIVLPKLVDTNHRVIEKFIKARLLSTEVKAKGAAAGISLIEQSHIHRWLVQGIFKNIEAAGI